MLVFASAPRIAHATEKTSPTAVKAACLRNLAKLVTWPETAFDDENSPIVIGVLGEDPFNRLLDKAIAGRKSRNRKLRARRLPVIDGELPSKERLSDCHLLFVSPSERERLPQILERLKGTHVMTVSDLDDFTHAGGVAQLQLVGANIRVRLNLQASKAAGLRPSFRLQQLAILDQPADPSAQND